MSFASGLGRLPGPGLGVVCADFDGDGWPDIFVANDGQPNRLWINQHDGTFKDEAVSRGVAYTAMGKAYAGMGVALGDVDDDGLLDLFVTHLGTRDEHALEAGAARPVPRPHRRRPAWRPRAGAAPASARSWPTSTSTAPSTSPSSTAASPDGGPAQDTGAGLLGAVRRAQPAVRQRRRGQVPRCLAGQQGVLRPLERGPRPGLRRLRRRRGAGPAGDRRSAAAPGCIRNVAPNRGHWLKVRAVDPKLKRDAYGAEVRVRAGDRKWLRLVNPAESYLCSSSPRALFGLGKADRGSIRSR